MACANQLQRMVKRGMVGTDLTKRHLGHIGYQRLSGRRHDVHQRQVLNEFRPAVRLAAVRVQLERLGLCCARFWLVR